MLFGISSLRGRFFFTAVILIALILPAVVITEFMVRNASNQSTALSSDFRDIQSEINTFVKSLQATESEIYHYSLLFEESGRRRVLGLLNETKRSAERLNSHPIALREPNLHTRSEQLAETLTKFEIETRNLLHVVKNVETRYPAAPILLEKLQPTSAEIIAAIELAIAEGAESLDEPQQQNIINKFRDLRYAWSQQVSSVRVYVANRSGIFGQPGKNMEKNALNRELYSERVQELVRGIQLYEEVGLLGFQQTQSIKRLKEAIDLYEQNFKKAADIYTSENWRADVPILNNKIRPSVNKVWEILFHIEDILENIAEDNANMLIHVSDSLSNIINLFLIFVVIILLVSYLILEIVIRRPIVEVTKALEAEGRGVSYLPKLSKHTIRETDVMVTAFRQMQEQVRSRQTRLESILTNAGEGIITIDANGIVETFNTAAQLLFGYTSDQVLGKNVNDIIKLHEARAYGDFLKFCQSPYAKNQLNEIVISTLRQDASIFPMSINVSELWVEERQLFIAIVEDISERVALMDNLRTMAEHDSLTGLYNREYFMTELDRVVENIKRGLRNDYALLYIDLDNFKFVNDTLGHLAGDQVLVEVTDMLSRRNRKSDLLARLGGDEFALMIIGATRPQVINAAESHRQLLEDYQFKYEGKIVNIGCSIGVTLFGQEPMYREDILVQADIACHIAKRSGRNRIHIYESDDKENMAAMSEDMGWAGRIKNAIDQNHFAIAAQPIVCLKDKSVQFHEVLLRMRSEDGSYILPAGFLPSAERFGLMRAIDTWVIETSIKILGKTLKENSNAHFSINLSAKSLEDKSMFQIITAALEKNNVSPTSVTFEITENVAIANMSIAKEFLNRLRSLGAKTALDDFGVGYSSFAYLKDLPVDYVKIDGSFVKNMHRDLLQLTMVRSMNDIAHALGKETVAEYVENKACMDKLSEIGVDYIQGNYTGRPKLVTEIRQARVESDSMDVISA